MPCLRYQSHQTDHSIFPAQSSAWPYRATHWGGLSNVSGSACTGATMMMKCSLGPGKTRYPARFPHLLSRSIVSTIGTAHD